MNGVARRLTRPSRKSVCGARPIRLGRRDVRYIALMLLGGWLWVATGEPEDPFGNSAVAIRLAKADQQPVDEQPSDKRIISDAGVHRAAYLLPVPLPISGDVDEQLRKQIEQVVNRVNERRAALTDDEARDSRPILVLEFGGDRPAFDADSENAEDSDRDGLGSQFERSLALARYLTSPELSGVNTVAWLRSDVRGHAVLPVIACESIITHPDAVLGEAGVDEPFIDDTIRQGYAEIATRRNTVPAPVVIGMLDRPASIVQVIMVDGGTEYVSAEESARLEKDGLTVKTKQLAAAGDLASFTGRAMRLEYQWASHMVEDQAGLSKALRIPPGSLISGRMVADGWKAVEAKLQGRLQARTINRLQRSIEAARQSGAANLLLLEIDSPGGDLSEAMRMLQYLDGLVGTEFHTVAFVPERALGDAALVALACDELVVGEDAVIGGPGEGTVRASELEALKESLRHWGAAAGRTWSLPQALVQPRLNVELFEHRETGEQRVFGQEELTEQLDAEQWQPVAKLDTNEGLTGSQLIELNVADHAAGNQAELLRLYGLQADQVVALSDRWAVTSVERLASQTWFARTLLFIAFFALMSEASSPGLGVPGFISLICFLLFFWSQFLNGTAEWLEVLLFAGGVAALVVEIFVVPGFGVFGVGGVLMIILSIVLASQTFVIPRTVYQVEQLTGSLLTVLVACAGVASAMIVMRHALAHAPFLNRMMLAPPDETEAEQLDRRESLAERDYLVGQQGRSKTPLVPAGKAQFGHEVVDVVSDGELIEANQPVEVVQARGNRVVVRLSQRT